MIDDHNAITQLIHRWGYCRDQMLWDELAETFHPEGTIAITWFNGKFSDFVAASKKMASGGSLYKHILYTPLLSIAGDRAVSETNTAIMGCRRVGSADVDLTSYARFYDLLEKRDGVWRISERTAIYEKDRLDSVEPSFLFWLKNLFVNYRQFPAAYRYLAAGLEESGHPMVPGIVVDRSPELARLYEKGERWLSSSADPEAFVQSHSS